MPFFILRDDITNVRTDAIVNTANRYPIIGRGVESAIYEKAGLELLAARREIGEIPIGTAIITPGFLLQNKYVIHTAAPIWDFSDPMTLVDLQKSYISCLKLAVEHNCESISFPLLSAGNNGVPKRHALKIATDTITDYLNDHDLTVYLVLLDHEAYDLARESSHDVDAFIESHHSQALPSFSANAPVSKPNYTCYNEDKEESAQPRFLPSILRSSSRKGCTKKSEAKESVCGSFPSESMESSVSLEDWIKKQDAGFTETLLDWIEKSGKKNSVIYKKANIDKKLFSKIINNKNYHPTKQTAVAFAIALELNWEDTIDLVSKAGYSLTRSNDFDLIIEYYVRKGTYNIFTINETLFDYDQKLLGFN